METIWGERRFLVPGIVFLSWLTLLAALSGGLARLAENGQSGAAVALAAVVAGGIAGYPLGLILHTPWAWLFRTVLGDYAHFMDFGQFARDFVALRPPANGVRGLTDFQEECQRAIDSDKRTHGRQFLGPDRQERQRQFFGFLYERLAPEATTRKAKGRWETFQTIGGMMSAIVAASLTYVVILAIEHDVTWRDERWPFIALALSGVSILVLLFQHARTIAYQAAEIDEQWSRLLLSMLRRNPAMLDMAVVDEKVASRLAGSSDSNMM